MELDDFARLARETDRTTDQEAGLQIALHGIAGEAGSVVSEAKKWFREGGRSPGLGARVEEELGDLLWYVASVANRVGLDLNEVAAKNLEKTAQMWARDLPPPSRYDGEWPDDQRLPRQMAVRFVEDLSGAFPLVRMEPLGELAVRVAKERERKGLGDPLNDNSFRADGYRYHDVIHLAHAAVLGWSPVLRSLMGAKRKQDTPDTDRVEDGARAIATEEGLAAFVFNYLEPDGFLAHDDRLPWELLKHIRRTVRGLEVQDQPPVAWEATYLQAFEIFRQLSDVGGGVIEADLDAQELRISELGPQLPEGNSSG
jgi:NTP pyrophosphatase (non-canonical NTP hydrolase)